MSIYLFIPWGYTRLHHGISRGLPVVQPVYSDFYVVEKLWPILNMRSQDGMTNGILAQVARQSTCIYMVDLPLIRIIHNKINIM